MTRGRPQQSGFSRGGFTFFEVLLSVSLSVLLLAVVYGAIHLSAKYSVAGQDEVERAQLARALLRDIESDLRATVYGRPLAWARNAQRVDDEPLEVPPISRPVSAVRATDVGLVGDVDHLVLQVDARALSRTRAANDGLAPVDRPVQLKLVAYVVAGKAGTTLPTLRQAGVPMSVTVETGTVDRGLVRVETDCHRGAPIEALSGRQPTDRKLELLAGEASQLRLRYFDGLTWRTSWDSHAMGGLPRAVDVALTIGAEDRNRRRIVPARQDVGETYRLVVPCRRMEFSPFPQ